MKSDSDVVIIKQGEEHFFVCTKKHSGVVTRNFVEYKSTVAKHFFSFEDAFEFAVSLKKQIEYPKCKLFIYDSRYFDEQNNAFFNASILNEIGDLIVGFSSKDHAIDFEYRFAKDDEDYQYVDVLSYRKALDSIIISLRGKDDLQSIGRLQALEFSYNASVPVIRYEIYKTEEYISLLENDKELYSIDIELLFAYIGGLHESIEMQKQCIAKEKTNRVHVFLIGVDCICSNPEFLHNTKNGNTIYIFHNNESEVSVPKEEPVMVYHYYKEEADTIIKGFGIDDSYVEYISIHNSKKPIKMARIISDYSNLFKLSLCRRDTNIDSMWIDSVRYVCDCISKVKEANSKK